MFPRLLTVLLGLIPVLLAGCQSPEQITAHYTEMSDEKLCGLRVFRWQREDKWAELTRRGFSKNCKNEIEFPKVCEEAAGLQKGTLAYAVCDFKVIISRGRVR